MVGTGGCETCIALVIKCKDGVAVYHFTAGDDPIGSLGAGFWGISKSWAGCEAIVCGGNNDQESLCLAKDVLSGAGIAGINVVGVSGASACGINPDGTWYDTGAAAGGAK